MEKKSNGALVGLGVIVVILIIGGIYIWMSNKNDAPVTTQNQSGNVTNQDSTDLNALEQSVNGADASTGVDVNSVN